MNAQELEQEHHMQLFKRYPLTLVEGRGSRVWDSEGKEYIDVLAGIAVNALGHSHPAVIAAIREQAGKLIHCSNFFYNEPQSRLAARLTEAAGMDRVFFTNSGTEAVEGALKLVKKYANQNGRDGDIVAMEGCFHGRSMGALSAHSEKQRDPFEPLLPGFTRVPFNDANALREIVNDQTPAVIIEPVQGEGGVRPATDDYLREVRKICDDAGALMIADEIQCGVGRTGTFYAYQGAGIKPDVVTSAKALGNGFPIGAVLARDEAVHVFDYGDHGTTYGGNPLACAAAEATVKEIQEEKLFTRAAKVGEHAMNRFREAAKTHASIKDVRGKGLMIGVELDRDCKPIVLEMLKRGVIANCTAETVVRFVPALTIPNEDLDEAIDVFIEVLKEQ